jgi:hypothetical protein
MGFTQNHEKLLALFQSAAEQAGIRFDPVEIKDDNFNKATVENAINSLYVNTRDIIIFYYSGHGFRGDNQNETNEWPPQMIMTFRPGVNPVDYAYPLVTAYSSLKAKGAGLTIVIGDCCNIKMGLTTPIVPDYPTFAPGDTPFNKSSLQKLFAAKGSCLVAAASPNEFATYYNTIGGYFCTNFYDSFMQETGITSAGEVSWKDIFENSKKLTLEKSQTDTRPETQTPIYYINIQ